MEEESKKKSRSAGQTIGHGEITSDDAKRFLDAAQASDFHALFALALASGMRPSEYLGLKWEDVDFERGTVAVKRTVQWMTGGGWKFGDTKTPNRSRQIPLPQSTVELLGDHRRKQKEERMRSSAEYQNNDLVFADDTGGPVTVDKLRRQHRAILRKAGLPLTIRVYDLRYTRRDERPDPKEESGGKAKAGM